MVRGKMLIVPPCIYVYLLSTHLIRLCERYLLSVPHITKPIPGNIANSLKTTVYNKNQIECKNRYDSNSSKSIILLLNLEVAFETVAYI